MLKQKLNELFAGYGYRRFRLSKFEEYDLYAGNKDFLKSGQLITFTDLDGSLLALKPDITLSIVKNNRGEDDKVFYNEMVYRAKDHHYREIPQAGVECLGNVDVYAEAEVTALACRALACIADSYVLRVSDVGFLQSVYEEEQIPESLYPALSEAVSYKNTDEITKLCRAGKISNDTAGKLKALISLYKPLKQGIDEAARLTGEAEKGELEHLRRIAEILEAFGVIDHVYLDFTLINSMDYYNGLIFQGAVASVPVTVLSGGRYDRLPKKMGKNISAIGFAVYMDAVENSLSPSRPYDADILITYTQDSDFVRLARIVEAYEKKGSTVRTVRRDAAKNSVREKRFCAVRTMEEAEREAGI
ncbi:MAG: ATP phosphoribosyltransferase regulatory subunit [Solobacterium sp.]|nr:ATP phosphoribosyltransferase regulatory subunit [Solobacterium sp.]